MLEPAIVLCKPTLQNSENMDMKKKCVVVLDMIRCLLFWGEST